MGVWVQSQLQHFEKHTSYFRWVHKILKTQCEMYKKTTMFSWWGTSCHMYHLMDVNPPHGCQSPTRRLFNGFAAALWSPFWIFWPTECCRVKQESQGFFDFWITKSFWIFFVRKCHQHFFGNDRSKHLSKNYNAMVHAHHKNREIAFLFGSIFFSLKENRSLPVGILSLCLPKNLGRRVVSWLWLLAKRNDIFLFQFWNATSSRHM